MVALFCSCGKSMVKNLFENFSVRVVGYKLLVCFKTVFRLQYHRASCDFSVLLRLIHVKTFVCSTFCLNKHRYVFSPGMPYIARKMACTTRPSLEIAKNEDNWTVTISTFIRTSVSKFKLGEEYEEEMPGGKLKVIL